VLSQYEVVSEYSFTFSSSRQHLLFSTRIKDATSHLRKAHETRESL